ncbi:hypothetical protein FOA52_006690 [Chlamydomonas sp. UWO 241]|nr:hypothetical protein FOA52_006690 [Chlamydomonas sp. UWO 241]
MRSPTSTSVCCRCGDDDDDGSHVVLAGNNASIVAMLFVPPPPPPPRGACTPRGGDGHHHHLARGPGGGGGGDGGMGLLAESPRLMLGTTRALALLDAQTYELAEAHFLRGGLPSEDAIWDHVARARRGSAATGAGQLPPQQLRLLPEASTAGAYALALAHGGGSGVAVAISAARQPSIAIFSIEQRRPPSPAPPAPGFDASLAAAAAGGGGGARTPLGDTAYEGSYASTSGGGNDDALFSAGRSAARDGSGGDARAPVSVFTTQPLPEGSYLRPLGSAPSSASGSPGRPGLPPRASPSKPSLGGKPGAGAGASSSPLARSSSTGSASVRFGGRPRSTVKPLTNQPVTFHKKVKSSGYGFVQPQIRIGATPPKKVAVSKSGSAATSALGRHFVQQRTYPLGCGPLVHAQPGNALPGGARAHNGAVLHLAFSPDARRLLTCSADKTARAMRLPLSTHAGDGTDFVAHDGAVTSACWSHDGTMVLTASADRTARMWNAGFAQPLLEFSHVNCQAPIAPSLKLPPISPSPGARGRSASAPIGSERPSPLALPRATQPADAANRPFAAEVRAAWFFYMDEFVIVASGPRLHLYRYKLLESADDDLERLRNNNKYKLVASYTSGSQAITDACCINTFLSPIALLTGSNKTIEVVDMSTMQRISCIEDVHARPANAIVQAVSSLYVSHPKEAYELFATSAPDNTAKLWDVRCARCVRTFTGHRSSQLPVGLAFSPCLRYLATGSEDRSAYLYDLRQGSVLHRLRGTHGDAVIDVAFNPLHPQLATGCLDGKVHFFSDAL